MSIEPRKLLAVLASSETLSGSALAERLGVTRAAIWKQIESLRALGAPITASRGRGYSLQWPLQLLDAESIKAKLDPQARRRLGAVSLHWQIDSTSTALMREAVRGAPDLSVCIAETQTAGRGRRGRTWRSHLGGNVYLSMLVRFPGAMAGLAGLSLASGVALIQALADCGVAGVGLKWPNDVVAGRCKLAGILVELGGEFLGPCFAVIGVGVNVRLPDGLQLDQPWTDLARLCQGAPPPRDELIARLVTRLIDVLDRFKAGGFSAIRADFEHYDTLRGRAVRIHARDGARDGTAAGVDARGALRVRHGAGERIYDSAEVSVREA